MLEKHETLKKVPSATAILKHYKSYLITIKRHGSKLFLTLTLWKIPLVYFNILMLKAAVRLLGYIG